MKTKTTKAPEHNVLGSESVLNHHLTKIVQLAVAKELRYQRSRLHALLSDGDEECTTMFDERIFELDPENKTADNPKTSVSKPKSKKGNKHPAFVLPKGFELPEEVEPFVNGLKWNIDRNEISAIVVGCGLNRQYGVKTKHTAMFFPNEEDAFLNVEGIFEAMMRIDGGTEVNRIINMPSGAKQHIRYKGWAQCRACGTRLGTSDEVFKDVTIPERAMHYRKDHGLRLNLFSTRVGKHRVFYVADHIQRSK